MLERIKKLQQPLCAVLLDKPHEVRSLLPEDIIEEVLEVLKPFHRATTTMSATVSMLSPLLYKLKFLVLKVSEEDSHKQFYWTYNIAICKISQHCWIYQPSY